MTKSNKVATFPIGSVGQHGPHLPLGTDHMVAWELSKRVAGRTGALPLPLLPYGSSDDHFPMAGTPSMVAEALVRVIGYVVASLRRSCAKRVVLLPGHAGHLAQLSDVAYRLNPMSGQEGIKVHNVSPSAALSMEALSAVLQEEAFAHAEELETSLIVRLNERLVDITKAVKEVPDFPEGLTTPSFMETIRILMTSNSLGRDLRGSAGTPRSRPSRGERRY